MANPAPVERAGRMATLTLLEIKRNSPERVEARRSQYDLVRIHDKPYVSRRKTDRNVVVVKVIVGLFVSR